MKYPGTQFELTTITPLTLSGEIGIAEPVPEPSVDASHLLLSPLDAKLRVEGQRSTTRLAKFFFVHANPLGV